MLPTLLNRIHVCTWAVKEFRIEWWLDGEMCGSSVILAEDAEDLRDPVVREFRADRVIRLPWIDPKSEPLDRQLIETLLMLT